jgi:hypothetical protein
LALKKKLRRTSFTRPSQFLFRSKLGSNYFSFAIKAGGTGGFFASVLAIGWQQPPAIYVSDEETLRGGAEGSFFAWGGATKPCSSLPLPAKETPAIRVTATAGTIYFFMLISFFKAVLNLSLFLPLHLYNVGSPPKGYKKEPVLLINTTLNDARYAIPRILQIVRARPDYDTIQ